MSAPAIHDLGYRRYEGARHGAREAWRALFWQGFRAMWGLGRPFKAKAIPVFVAVVTTLPVLASLTASSVSGGQLPIRYGMLVSGQLVLFILFAAAQAPEVVSRDQQHRVLPLILTRDVTRLQYATARLAAVWFATFTLCLAPLLLAYVGEIGIAKNPAVAFNTMGSRIGPVLLYATITSWLFATVGAALASMSARRAYATASVIGLFLVVGAITTGLDQMAGLSDTVAVLLDPLRTLRTLAMVLFAETTRAMEITPPPPVAVLLAMLVAIGSAASALLLWRLRRLRV